MMLLRSLRGSVPLGLWLSPHRADTIALIVNPAIFVQRAIYRWLNPPRLTCSRVVCQPRRSRQHIACMRACSRQGCTRADSSERARVLCLQYLEIDIANTVLVCPTTSFASLRRHLSRKRRLVVVCYGYLSDTSPPNHQLPYPGTSACHRQPRRGPSGRNPELVTSAM